MKTYFIKVISEGVEILSMHTSEELMNSIKKILAEKLLSDVRGEDTDVKGIGTVVKKKSVKKK
jgi:hypothetical protein